MSTILIKNGVIVPMNGADRTIENRALLIKDDKIQAIGEPEALEKEYAVDKTVDAAGKAILPGFVNAHTHAAMTVICRGVAEDIEDYFFTLGLPLDEVILQDEDFYLFARLGCIDMLRSGNTCISELMGRMNGTAKAIEETGIRGVLGPDIQDVADIMNIATTMDLRFDSSIKERQMKEAVRIFDTWHGSNNGRITCHFTNNIPLFCSPEAMAETKQLANERGVGVKSHVNSEKMESILFKQIYQKSAIEFLQEIDYLDEKTNLIHMIYSDDREIEIVKETGAAMVHCPIAFAKTGDCAPMSKMYGAGLNIVLGSDWLMMDPFEQMRAAVMLARISSGEKVLLKAYDFLEMFTIKAAKSLGLGDRVGSLEVGKQADCILVDYNKEHILPMNSHHDLVTNLVYYARGSDVDTVIVDGEVVIENREVLTCDIDEIKKEVQTRSHSVLNKLKDL